MTRRLPHCAMRRTAGLRRQAGFTLLETLIALGIGVFLLGGIAVVMSVTRQNFNAQAGLGQLQDDQRVAVNVLVTVVEHAGYFFNPQAKTADNTFLISAPFASPGQTIAGISGTGSTADTLSVRYLQSPQGAANSDFMQDCNGGVNGAAAPVMSVNTFTLNSNNELSCAAGTNAAMPLASGISAFSVLYGVDTNNDKSADQYLPAGSMTTDYWLAVASIQVTIVFTNPLDSSKPITVVRVINVMNQA